MAFVYILASERNGTLYVGATSDLPKRIHQHKSKLAKGFTSTYQVDKLVWFEEATEMLSAIAREKQIKKWKRAWKTELMEQKNPYWNDLYPSIL